jgi:phosphate transport system ATP-binding protein
VTRDNFGIVTAQVAGAALLIGYVLTVAVSVAAGSAALSSSVTALAPWRVPISLGFIALIAFGNLRGVRESGRIFAAPTFFFMANMAVLLGLGLVRPLPTAVPARGCALGRHHRSRSGRRPSIRDHDDHRGGTRPVTDRVETGATAAATPDGLDGERRPIALSGPAEDAARGDVDPATHAVDPTTVIDVDELPKLPEVRLAGGPPPGAAALEAQDLCAWFGDHLVLEGVDLTMPAGEVTALIGPSGCGKSTFLRELNRMHELVPSASLAGEVLLDGEDIYRPGIRAQEVRLRVGMVFQKPNPFPAMSVRDNVLSGLKLARIRCSNKDALVEQSLIRAGLWREVRDRLGSPGGALSGGQQQRLCIARALAVQPNVLLMDEPCSALDPTSTRRIEDTIGELRGQVTVVIVTHNMQQAYRVSEHCAFFLAAENEPGRIVELGSTQKLFSEPDDSRTLAYVAGRFG